MPFQFPAGYKEWDDFFFFFGQCISIFFQNLSAIVYEKVTLKSTGLLELGIMYADSLIYLKPT